MAHLLLGASLLAKSSFYSPHLCGAVRQQAGSYRAGAVRQQAGSYGVGGAP